MSVTEAYHLIKSEIPEQVNLIAVSKTVSTDKILEVYNEGQRAFGENKVQELLFKYNELPKDIEWHLIGHLQTNKVKQVVPFVKIIHSIDSLKLLIEINKEAKKINRVIDCLLEFHIASEETKFGLSLDDAIEILTHDDFPMLLNIRIVGIMGMASFTDDIQIVRKEFRTLAAYFRKLKYGYMKYNPYFKEISMGMSDDFKIAIKEGSTMVRVGSAIFGERVKKTEE
ncbi:MAG: YggS family pyridoxal phosphate-dependent enzyme [Bacteroidota bacterium]|nr:YggS family pyridoxal phosphate-dependent enzyme [Bacteroidota bacterium]